MCDINSTSMKECLGPKQAGFRPPDKSRAIKGWLSAI